MKTHTLFNLGGRVAIVTGGNSRIGRGIAIGLAEAGAAVTVFERNDETNQRVLGELRAIGNPAISMNVDVAGRNGLEPAIQRVESESGSVEILVIMLATCRRVGACCWKVLKTGIKSLRRN